MPKMRMKIPRILLGLFMAIFMSKYKEASARIKETVRDMEVNALIVSLLLVLNNTRMKKNAEIAVRAAPIISSFVRVLSEKVQNAEKMNRIAANADDAFIAIVFGVNSVLICEEGIKTIGDKHHSPPMTYRAFVTDVASDGVKYPISAS